MKLIASVLLLAGSMTVSVACAQTVVFEQAGFPSIETPPLSHTTLVQAFSGGGTVRFEDVAQISSADALKGARLLVLPYGSAFPAKAWPAIKSFVDGGGNLLLIGGQPLRVPVEGEREGGFTKLAPQDNYSRSLEYRHSYAVPMPPGALHFRWREGYESMGTLEVHAQKVFAEEGRLNGLGYLDSSDGTHVAAPVIVSSGGSGERRGRIVSLPFQAEPGYWKSKDGLHLLQAAAKYAAAGENNVFLDVQYSAVRPDEAPQMTVHLHRTHGDNPRTASGSLQADVLRDDGTMVSTHAIDPSQDGAALPLKPLPPGVYRVRVHWKLPDGTDEFAENGFVVEALDALATGDALGVHGDFLSLGGKPFFPVGANYFSTDANGWDFSGPRNDATWERDFADMERHGVNFVRTGVWMPAGKFVEPQTGEANERFLRNVEAYLSAAHRHNIAVNFTFFAFTPQVFEPHVSPDSNAAPPPPPNPYLDPAAVDAERAYVVSVARRFHAVPWLSYDLINEPSFSNPRNIFHGNLPNGDAEERSAWDAWLERRYGSLEKLADAWRTTPGQLAAWSSIPLPKQEDLAGSRYGNANGVRALDYNLFAQDTFGEWLHGMVDAIHATGSTQLINVGQDEGGVTDRLLNQFYATDGVSFTTNHTYWQDDALLWDSVAAKRPGMPNITGETGYQPAWNPDGTWRYDELTGTAMEERKWALGFAAGSSGAMQWDWDREVDFGIERSDGSAKVWEGMMRDLGTFARQAAPFATALTLPQVAIVLPQSLQMSTRNGDALQAQQTAVRVLYQYNRVEAYAVGEYQTAALGAPKLIVLPSAYGLTEKAWSDIEARVRQGAVLLISGPFSGDAHMHPTSRAEQLGLHTTLVPLQTRDAALHAPFGDLPLVFSGSHTTFLDRAVLDHGKEFADIPMGKGKVLFSSYPLELNNNLESVARVYDAALNAAGVTRTYTTTVANHGILICPTRLPQATMYVLSSETETTPVSFTDVRSGVRIHGTLEGGRAALLLVGSDGTVLAQYHWSNGPAAATR